MTLMLYHLSEISVSLNQPHSTTHNYQMVLSYHCVDTWLKYPLTCLVKIPFNFIQSLKLWLHHLEYTMAWYWDDKLPIKDSSSQLVFYCIISWLNSNFFQGNFSIGGIYDLILCPLLTKLHADLRQVLVSFVKCFIVGSNCVDLEIPLFI